MRSTKVGERLDRIDSRIESEDVLEGQLFNGENHKKPSMICQLGRCC